MTRYAFFPDKNKLLLGDVLLIKSRKLTGKVISFFDGYYTHAAIYVGDGVFIEATWEFGVRRSVCDRFSVKDRDDIKIRRVKNLNKEFSEGASKHASKFLARNYDKTEAIFSVRKNKKIYGENSERGVFCSYLVYLCYQYAGLELEKEIKIEPRKITPEDINKSSELEDVYGDVVVYKPLDNRFDFYGENSMENGLDYMNKKFSEYTSTINNFLNKNDIEPGEGIYGAISRLALAAKNDNNKAIIKFDSMLCKKIKKDFSKMPKNITAQVAGDLYEIIDELNGTIGAMDLCGKYISSPHQIKKFHQFVRSKGMELILNECK